ncbi:MAG: hypothetical protein ACI8WY_002864, partial [Planctomycetota bacterium]
QPDRERARPEPGRLAKLGRNVENPIDSARRRATCLMCSLYPSPRP